MKVCVGIPLADDCIGSTIKYFNMGCAAWACAGNNVEDAIVVEVDGCNANATAKGLVVGEEGSKNIEVCPIEDANFWAAARASRCDDI